MFEREARREKILEARHRELKLKERTLKSQQNEKVAFTFTCGEGDHISGHPALRPLHGPSAQMKR